MTSSTPGSGDGSARATARRFLKRDLPENAELSWLCPIHQDPDAMKLVLRTGYLCAHCQRERSRS
ncbi:hypothetical protein [Streptomyces melanogenes]|uniref:hypothetical protein n=1 Tax=Streptomyces melanogenes TaxID=67326 RepID=UPI00167E1267|nr:hypothetical protein [Streptomyces melanogenes]GGP95808.1 hypothetical protein GCM10010278_86810 [Streptomyces melanogenes]